MWTKPYYTAAVYAYRLETRARWVHHRAPRLPAASRPRPALPSNSLFKPPIKSTQHICGFSFNVQTRRARFSIFEAFSLIPSCTPIISLSDLNTCYILLHYIVHVVFTSLSCWEISILTPCLQENNADLGVIFSQPYSL